MRRLVVGGLAFLFVAGSACDDDGLPSPLATASPGASTQVVASPTPFALPPGVPSGALIFRAAGNLELDVMMVNADGTALVNLTEEGVPESSGAWSPDGREIAYTRGVSTDALSDIIIVAADGSNPRNVTATADVDETFVSWSPDGSKILFAEFGYTDAEYWVMKADGTNRTRVVPRCVCFRPQWLPDGQRLLAELPPLAVPASGHRIVLLDLSGSVVNEVTEIDYSGSDPQISPDGKRLAYGSGNSVWLVDVDSGSAWEAFAGASPYAFAWSTGGSRLAFSSSRREDDTALSRTTSVDDLTVLEIGTGEVSTLTSHDRVDGVTWSPDGEAIAFSGLIGDDREVFVIPVAGGSPVNVSRDPLADTNPSWSPDGERLLFASSRRTREGIGWLDPETGSSGVVVRGYAIDDDDVRATTMGGCRTPAGYSGPAVACLSPDGALRAEVGACVTDPGRTRCELVIRGEGSGAVIARTPAQFSVLPSSPAWSPDGARVAFVASASGTVSVYSFAVATSELVPLVAADGFTGDPLPLLWSLDAQEIYFTRGSYCREGCASGYLYRAHADGSGEERVLNLRIARLYGFAP